jgi:hypothetical protein
LIDIINLLDDEITEQDAEEKPAHGDGPQHDRPLGRGGGQEVGAVGQVTVLILVQTWGGKSGEW